MATTMLLQAAPRSVAELPGPSVLGSEVYTMLQAPSIGGERRFGSGRKSHGACRRAMPIGFRAQRRPLALEAIRKVKKNESEIIEADISEGTKKVRKSPGLLKFGKGKKDNKIVFVAGATGKLGSRVVRELRDLGFQVQASVRDVARGQILLETLDETKSSDDKAKTSWAAKLFKPKTSSRGGRVELVECDLENEDDIESSLGNAGVVVCAIGASEKEVLDSTGPYRIDYKATENLIKAATNAEVNHFILVTSLCTTKLGWPASVLNLFWGVLVWKAKAEKALEESGLPYTIVRPGGMEKPTDAYKETHNLILAPKDTFSGGQVSSLQVAELIARCVSNLGLARYKVLEAVAETAAPLRPIEDLLAEAPAVIDEDDRETTSSELAPSPVRKSAKISRQQEDKSAKLAQAEERRQQKLREKSQKEAEAAEKRKKDLEEKSRKAAEADEKKKRELFARYERDLLAAREEEELARRKVDEALSLKAQLEKRTADLQVQARTAAREAKKARALENAIAVAARQASRLSEKEKREILEAASAEFDGERKALADTDKMPQAEKKTPLEFTSTKPDKNLQFKALRAAKLKEAEDRAAKKSAEMERLAKQQQEAAEKEEKERVNRQEIARLENEAKTKLEAEAKAQAEKDRLIQEENEAKAKAEAEAQAQAERERVTQEINETKAAEDEEAVALSKKDDVAEEDDAKDNEVIAKSQGQSFRWPWQKQGNGDDEPSETFAENGTLKEMDDLSPPPDSKPVSAASDDALLGSPASETPTPPSVPVIQNEVSEFVEEVAEETEAIVEKARKAKEDAATRAAVALEKAKTPSFSEFRWPWQKESAEDEVSSEASTTNEIVEEKDVAQTQIDPELESSATPLEDSESEGTEKSDDSSEQPSSVIKNVENAVTEVAENSASDESLPESPESEPPSSPSPPVIEDKVSNFVEEVAEDAEAMKEKARKAKEEAATRAAIALEKAKGAASRGFQWPWQKKKVFSETSSVADVSRLEDSEGTTEKSGDSELTTEKSEDSSVQVLDIVNETATEIVETAEALDSAGATNVVREGEEESLAEPEEENDGAPVSEIDSEPVSATSGDASLETPDSETSPPPSASAVEAEESEVVEEITEDTEATKAKENEATKAKGFRWLWDQD